MKKMKRYSRTLAGLFLTLVLAVSGIYAAPAQVRGADALLTDADAIADYVNSRTRFESQYLKTYTAYLELLTEKGNYTDECARLTDAIAVLNSGYDLYDDFEYFGEYTSVAAEPAKAGDVFETTTNTSNYEIIWGGAKAQQLTDDQIKDSNGNYIIKYYHDTYPRAYSSTSGLTFEPFHFTQYLHKNAENNHTSTLHSNAGYSCHDTTRYAETYEDIWDRFNMVTLKTGIITEGEKVESFGGSFQWKAAPIIVYNYIDRDNWAAFTSGSGGNGGIIWIESREGILYPRPETDEYNSFYGNNGGSLVNYTNMDTYLPDSRSIGTYVDFDMTWNDAKACYVLTLTSQSDSGSPIEVALDKGELAKTKLSNVVFGVKPSAYDGSLTAHTFASAVGSLKVAYTDVVGNHTCVYNREQVSEKYLLSEQSCQSAAVYYKSCSECDGFSTEAETFTIGEKGEHAAGTEYTCADGMHWYACMVCNEPMGDKETCAGADTWQQTDTEHWLSCGTCGTEMTGTRAAHSSTNVAGYTGSSSCDTCGRKLGEKKEIDFYPEILGSKLLKNSKAASQSLRIDIDFSNIAKADGSDITITEYGIVVKPKTNENTANTLKTLAQNSSAAKADGVLRVSYATGSNPGLMKLNVKIAAEDYGKRIILVAYLKDSRGNYYFSNTTKEAVGLTDGVINTGVMRVMKNILADESASGCYTKLESAVTSYYGGEDFAYSKDTYSASDVLSILRRYLGKEEPAIDTADTLYETAKTFAIYTFWYCQQ